jgi:hypothetical protein
MQLSIFSSELVYLVVGWQAGHCGWGAGGRLLGSVGHWTDSEARQRWACTAGLGMYTTRVWDSRATGRRELEIVDSQI